MEKMTGKVCVVMHVPHSRLKSAGASWQAELALLLKDLRCKSVKADADIWICEAVMNVGHECHDNTVCVC